MNDHALLQVHLKAVALFPRMVLNAALLRVKKEKSLTAGEVQCV